MYNGIGLTTPRGSGTNGYVVRNMSFVRPPPMDRRQHSALNDIKGPPPPPKQPNKEILLHDRKRKVEVELMELRIKLEDEGVDPAEIENTVADMRQKLFSKIDKVQPRDAKDLREHETHQLTAAKEEENKKMMRALGIDNEKYVEGAAFDRELQEKLKEERMAKRAAEREAMLQAQQDREKEREKERRERARAREKRHKEEKRREEPQTGKAGKIGKIATIDVADVDTARQVAARVAVEVAAQVAAQVVVQVVAQVAVEVAAPAVA
ncbi:RNA-splicing factor [Apophysomyces sp. BC1034]|nr:RNA-splicing factor [Apophysomyces sp. BC1034]